MFAFSQLCLFKTHSIPHSLLYCFLLCFCCCCCFVVVVCTYLFPFCSASYPLFLFINHVLYILFNLRNQNWNILCHHFARSVCKSAEVPCTNKQTNKQKPSHSGDNLIWILRHCGLVAGTCEYKGQNYYQGQQWQDGCDYQCTCTDSKTGHYECHEL